LQSTFKIVRGWIDEQQLEQLGAFLYRLKNQAIVIRLDVSEAKDAFKLFETINNRGLRLSPTDIIKNFCSVTPHASVRKLCRPHAQAGLH
jgi:uncharacterized protein with ParB-like and HNH nuclease domain